MTKINKTEQIGRSMVEMLGVLAVIGVLSITGISGYTTAINKHKANQILDAASKRAVAVSTQIQRGNPAPSLAEFEDEAVGGATFGTSVKNTAGTADFSSGTDNRFTLTLSNIDPDICKQMQSIAGNDGIVRDFHSDCSKLTYNNDLTTDAVASDYKTESDCTKADKKWCSNNTCADVCCSVGSLTGLGEDTGVLASDNTSHCYCANKGEVYNSTQGCQVNAGTDCTSYRSCGANQFCYFGNTTTCDRSGHDGCSHGAGTCIEMSNGYEFPSTPVSITGIGDTWGGTTMDWYSANDWCKANGKELISVEDVKCYRSGTSTQVKSGDIAWVSCCAENTKCSNWANRNTNGLFSPVIVDIAAKYGTEPHAWTSSPNNDGVNGSGDYAKEAIPVNTRDGAVTWSLREDSYCFPLCK